MKKTIPLLSFIVLTAVCLQAQDFQATLGIKLKKDASPFVFDFGSGFHCIFIDKEKLQYNRINYDFVTESTGEIDLSELGFRPKLIEINGSRKNIHIYFTRTDSIGLRCLTINTINKKISKKVVDEGFDKKAKIMHHFSATDTLHMLYTKGNNELQYRVVANNKMVSSKDFSLDAALMKLWQDVNNRWPQLQKAHVGANDLAYENKIQFSPVKSYLQHRYLYITVEQAFNTHIIIINRKLESLNVINHPVEISVAGGLGGAICNSYILGKYLFQAVLAKNGCFIQKTDLKFNQPVYSTFANYHYTISSNSPVFLLNRKERGNFEKETGQTFNFHADNQEKYLGLHVSKKGPFDHFMVSEVELLPFYDGWINKANDINTENARRKEKGIYKFYSLLSQYPARYYATQYLQCMASTFCITLGSDGSENPYLGDVNFAMAKGPTYFYALTDRGALPTQPTFAAINQEVYFCFYRKGQHLYYFIKL
ncbi:hypothetical protein GC194_01080 [bacterium]|nr:hypothetical protein [bacterium]